ncbi:MAG: hypothetical protein ABGY41_13460, partial [Candidatus Poribacteria bacterium]
MAHADYPNTTARVRVVAFAILVGVAWIARGRAPDTPSFVFVEDVSGTDLDVIRMDGSGANVTNLTRHPALDVSPVWSPSGRHVAFASWRDGDANVYVMEPDGSNLRRLTDGPQFDQSPTWSPSGKEVAFASDAGISVIDVASGAMREVTTDPPGISALGGG